MDLTLSLNPCDDSVIDNEANLKPGIIRFYVLFLCFEIYLITLRFNSSP